MNKHLPVLITLLGFSLVGCDAIEEYNQKKKAESLARLDEQYAYIKEIPAEKACLNEREYLSLLELAQREGIDKYISLAEEKLSQYKPICVQQAAQLAEERRKKEELEKLGDWRVDYYVDDFGDPTSSSYISNRVDGTFSNSATSDSYLYVQLLIDSFPNAWIHFRLSEYDKRSPVTGYMTYGQKFSGRVRDDKGITTNFDATLSKGSIGIFPEQQFQKTLMSLIESNQNLRFILSERDGTATYRFSINTSYFANAKRKALERK